MSDANDHVGRLERSSSGDNNQNGRPHRSFIGAFIPFAFDKYFDTSVGSLLDKFRYSHSSTRSAKQSTLEQAWSATASTLDGKYWKTCKIGLLSPLSLKEYCVRSICIQLLRDVASMHHDSAKFANQDIKVSKPRESAVSRNAIHPRYYLTEEIAIAMLKWLRDRQILCRLHYELLSPFLGFHWDLQSCENVEDSWFENISLQMCERIQLLDISHCVHLRSCAALSHAKLPNLITVSFAGCNNLENKMFQRLQYSSKLTSINLNGCRLITDKTLHCLRHLFRLEYLNLSECKWVTEKGLRHLSGLFALKNLNLGRCMNVSNEAFVFFPQSFPNLQELDISYCPVSDSSMPYIAKLHELRTAVMRGCHRITDKGLRYLSLLSKLRHFDARKSKNMSAFCQNWKSIEVLWIGETGFQESGASVLCAMNRLRDLDLSNCRISKQCFKYLSQMVTLKRLVLAETALTDQSLLLLCSSLSQLQTLDISSTEVSDSGTKKVGKLKHLVELNMDTRGVSDISLEYVSQLTKLETLDLFGASVTDAGMAYLAKLPSLSKLTICGGGISSLGIKHLAKMYTLKSLNLSQNRNIDSRGLRHLRELCELQCLNLSNTGITSNSLRNLCTLKELQSLSVYGCALNSKAIDELRVAHPKLRCLRCA